MADVQRPDPAEAGIDRPKRQIFTDSFDLPEEKPRRGRPRKEPAARKPPKKTKGAKPVKKATSKATPKARTPKPRVQPTQAEIETRIQKRREYERKRSQTPERKEQSRRYAQAKRDEAKALGLCVGCGGPAIKGETRCETCTAKHRGHGRRTKERAAEQRD